MRPPIPLSILNLVIVAEHGSRRRYRQGCRCLMCRAANAAVRRQPPRPLVPSSDAQAHLERLKSHGIGYRQVARLTGLHASHVVEIRAGLFPKLRQHTAAVIAACRPIRAPHALVTSWWPRRHVSALVAEGFTARQITQATGVRLPALEQAAQVRQRTAVRIATIYRDVIDDADFGRRSDWLRSLEA